jgi:surface carbohydrate biosynthesis protein
LFISIYRPWRKLPDSYYELLKTINIFFSNKVNGKLYILGAMIANSQKEKNFYDKLLNNTDYTFLPRFVGRPTYDIVDQSKIILATESTLAYEAFGRGNKVAYFSLSKSSYPEITAKFGWPSNKRNCGPFWTNSAKIKKFARLMDYLNNLKYEDYYKILNKYSSDLIKFDEGNKKFIKLINKLI